jgi:hypothetical protein
MPTCNYTNCKEKANYNYKHEKERLYCITHRKDNMIILNEKSKYCIENDCTKKASYNLPNQKKPIYCKDHAKDGNVNVKAKKCIEEGCKYLPSYNYKDKKTRLYCCNHAKEGMVNLSEKTCIIENCIRNAYYNFPDKKDRLYCREHADLENMIDLTHKICIVNGCNIQACYNLSDEDKPLYCKKHSTDIMIDIRSKKCLECNKKPTFNYSDSIGALYCFDHKKENMINIYQNICIFEGCTISASYNYEGSKKRLYCTKHKLENMINLSKVECEYKGCNITASYNYIDEKHPRFCSIHKLESMILLNDTFFCKEINCNKRPTFNIINNPPHYCYKHKKDNMINVKDPLCKECPKTASFNYKDSKIGLYCYDHSKESMINIYSLRCKKEDCDIIIRHNNKYDGYCVNCYIKEFPNEKISNNYILKEKAVREYIVENFNSYDWLFNKHIKNSKYKYRPDALLDLETHTIIIEIDEYQHALYDEDDEEKRILDIYDALEKKKIVLIRFNPDSYRDENGDLIKSPWIYYRTKLKLSSDKKLLENWDERLLKLKNNINNSIENIPDKNIEIIKLYFT